MRLRRVEPYGSGIRRSRRGSGFAYVDDAREPVRDAETLERIEGLVIPPAWERVWISADPAGHIQAVGYDDAGRRQYIYHPRWREERDDAKHDRVLALAERLPAFRAHVTRDLHARGATRERVLAAALRIIDRGVFRPGGEEYADENGGYGVATLLRSHVHLHGDEVEFRYPAKAGVPRRVAIEDEDLAATVRAMRRADTDRFLTYRDPSRGWRDVHAEDINERFRELTGPDYTVKDLRTWHATVAAAKAFAHHGPDEDPARAEAEVIREVAEKLGNTPAVARDAYVDPRVIEAFREGRTVPAGAGEQAVRDLLT